MGSTSKVCAAISLLGVGKKGIVSLITTELDWQKYAYSDATWRSDCKIALLKNYLYWKTIGFTKNDEILSGMIRQNMITREETLERVTRENAVPDRFVIEFLNDLGLDYGNLQAALAPFSGQQSESNTPTGSQS